MQQLLKEIDPDFVLEPAAEEMIMEMADDFVKRVTGPACLLAKHRKSETLEVKDLQVILDKHWGIKIAGIGPTRAPLKVPLYVRPPAGTQLQAPAGAKKKAKSGRGKPVRSSSSTAAAAADTLKDVDGSGPAAKKMRSG